MDYTVNTNTENMKTYNYTLYHESLRSYNSLRILIIFRLGIGAIFCFISTYHESLLSYNSLRIPIIFRLGTGAIFRFISTYRELLRSYNSLRILIIFRLGIGAIFRFISTYHESLRFYNSLRILIIFRLRIGAIFCFISTYHKSSRSYTSLHNTYALYSRLAAVPSCPIIPLKERTTFPRHGNIPVSDGLFRSYHLISLLYSIVSYSYGTIHQPHATYKTFDSHTLITMRIVTIQHKTQVYKCEYR
jgi:hypothetical protein